MTTTLSAGGEWTDADLDKAAFERWRGESNKHVNLRLAFQFGAYWARQVLAQPSPPKAS